MSDQLTWIENPENVGLRLVGLAHDVAPAGYCYARPAVEHRGWYLDSDGMGETVAGVVYQLPGRNGRARYVVGYADPFNADREGRGPACLDLANVILGERLDSSWEQDSGLRDAARAADGHAESMAEIERDYRDAWDAGRDARELGAAMREAAATWAEDMRAVRSFFAMRHAAPGAAPRRATLRSLVRHARKSCEALEAARVAFHGSLDRGWHDADAWGEGYAQ